jgi:hypothetical protein
MLAKQFVNSSKLLEQRLAFVLMFYVTDVCPRPARAQPHGYYSRLFPSAAQPLSSRDEERLIRLGESMRYVSQREGTLTPRVGFTYFGQFVGHDLSHDTTPLARSHPVAERVPNYRSAYLNLEQIYGGGPMRSPQLFEGESGAEIFRIGKTRQGRPRDLPIEAGELLIADQRNLDNLILRQLHVVFLKFHNEAVKQLSVTPTTIEGADGIGSGTIFERAQRLVRWHYQWIVRHDFLPRILHNSFWFNRDRSDPLDSDSMPMEFSLAAYRFGHSMVRPAYGLNCQKKRVEISELMALGHERAPVGDDFLIEWGRFFDGLPRSGPVASSSYLDTALAPTMHRLPESILRLCVRGEASDSPMNLPIRTLLRGARAWLPSGQEVATLLSNKGILPKKYELTPDQLIQDTCNQSGTVLRATELHENTPLFYYILKEAEIVGQGRRLGLVGSYIVGQVIRTALYSDPDGYLSAVGPNWQLPQWRFPSGSIGKVNSLINVIRLVGYNKLLPECDAKWRSLQLGPLLSQR